MTIKAIETKYKGYRFRSRLEARWAVFFDALGLEWEYESQGFERTDPWVDPDDAEAVANAQWVRYLPDFYLPRTKTWVEVKPRFDIVAAARMADMLDWGSPMPHINGSYNNKWYDRCPGLLLLGDVPYIRHGFVIHPITTHEKGLHREYAMFTADGLESVGARTAGLLALVAGTEIADHQCIDAMSCDDDELGTTFDPAPIVVPAVYAYPKVCKAYTDARSARFEHGECGAPA